MSLAEAQSKSGHIYKVHQFFFDYKEVTTPAQMETSPYIYIYDESEGYMLDFNLNKRLIEKTKVKWFGIDVKMVVRKALGRDDSSE